MHFKLESVIPLIVNIVINKVIMKNCLIICSSFFPAYKSGGPTRSLSNLAQLIGKQNKLDVITADRDMGENKSFDSVNIDSWANKYFFSRVFYMSPKFRFLKKQSLLIDREYDVVYLNSFFDYKFSIRFLLLTLLGGIKCNEILLAPRGELTLGAMSFKTIKKNIYLRLFKFFKIHKKVTFHFTSKEEVSESLSYLGKVKFKLIPNMHEYPPSYFKKDKEVNTLNLIFLSRISPKKNLLTIIKSLEKVFYGQISLSIAGVVDDNNYWELCKKELKNLPSNIEVSILGTLDRKEVELELSRSHIFFLPTLNENYGHAIVEAMMSSNIIIISNKTPWSDVIEHGSYVGEINDIEYYREAISKVLSMDSLEFNSSTKQTYDFCDQILNENENKIENLFN
jgi:glycosyltransferase involved in cell wall biosynthesis